MDRHAAATRLQAHARGRRERVAFQSARGSLVRLQAWVRGELQRKRYRQDRKVTRDLSAILYYRSAVTPAALDWRLEGLQARHDRVAVLACAGVACMVVMSELVYDAWKAHVMENLDGDPPSSAGITACRWLIFLTTALLQWALVEYHRFLHRSRKSLFGAEPLFWDSAASWARDACAFGVHPFVPVPGLPRTGAWRLRTATDTEFGVAYYGVEDLFAVVSVLMLFRVPLVLLRRLWLQSKALRLKSRFLARATRIDLSARLAVRVAMRDGAVGFLTSAGLLALACLGYSYYVFERETAFLAGLLDPQGHDPFSS